MTKSVITRSTPVTRARSMPCWPSAAWMTVWPAWPNAFESTRRSISSSSIKRIFAMDGMWRRLGRVRGDRWRRLVDDGPENTELADGRNKLVEIDGFHDVAICTQFVAFHEIVFFARGG